MEDILFDLGVAQVVQSGGDPITKAATAAWRSWCDLTQRTDRSRPDRKFMTAYRAAVARHVPQDQVLRLVSAAARVPPHGRDSADLRRVVRVLEGGKASTYALALLDSGAEVIPFPHEGGERRSSLEQVEQALGTMREDWVEEQRQGAATVMEIFEPDALAESAQQVKLMLGLDVLMPSDLLRHHRSARRGRVVRNDRRESFQSGRSEQADLEGILLTADVAAKRAHLNGAGPAQVRRFHEAAPQGYWEAVLDAVESGRASDVRPAYDLLRSEWDFHPDQREPISAAGTSSARDKRSTKTGAGR